MCGIAGYFSSEALNGEEMIYSLKHRGPDHLGRYQQHLDNGHLFLGHTRLSIIDTSSNGNQPMVSSDGETVLTYNGEIYNFQKLRKQFLRDIPFQSETDSETILYLYKKLGAAFVDHLIGDFAFCIYDQNEHKLLIYRDRVGVKPLYYYHSEKGLIFGSEIKAILAAGISAQLDNGQVLPYLIFKYSPDNDTLFKGIRRVPPAHFLEYNLLSKELNIREYWKLQENTDVAQMGYKEATEQLKSMIEEAVEMQLLSDVPIGTFFSGGLDSSIIAHYMRNKEDMPYYCASKSEKDLKREGTTSDFHHARALANLWNLDLKEIPVGSNEANLEMIRTTLKYSDDLIADGSQIPSYIITRAASEKSTVILTGMGADELFLGYAGHQISYLSLWLDQIPGFLRKGINNQLGSLEAGKGKFKAFKRYLYKLGRYHNYGALRFGCYNLVGDPLDALAIANKGSEGIEECFGPYYKPGADPFKQIFEFEMKNFLVKNLHYIDRMSMANSIETRVPFLDHRIITFAYNLKRSYKLNYKMRPKRILKDAYADSLPASVIKRRKAGFGMPLRSILSDPGKVNELLQLDFFANFEQFSPEEIQRVCKEHLEGRKDHSSIIYSLISFQEWYKMYIA